MERHQSVSCSLRKCVDSETRKCQSSWKAVANMIGQRGACFVSGACHDIAGLGRVRRCVAVGIYHVAVHIAAVIAQLRATVCKQALEFDNVCKPA